MPGTRIPLEIVPRIPHRLTRLEELANNLWYSWDRPTRELFSRLHSDLWRAVGHRPKAFLKRVDQRLLDEAARNPEFIGSMERALSAFDAYMSHPPLKDIGPKLAKGDLIAYFCAEFGFHESLPIYSGGLGILAGDHCKTASDLNLPFVGVGLLYRQGYFQQEIDREGRQAAIYTDSDFDDLPIDPARLPSGEEAYISVELPGRIVEAKVWQVAVGTVRLYLLDTDLEKNSPQDRNITHRLYGGDKTTRIEQEIILGIGGVRALQVLEIRPTVWHINEGHAAFLILERVRRAVVETGLDFSSALELVASNLVFTTHTAVPAGHDHFGEDMIRRYFEHCAAEIGCSMDALLALGRLQGQHDFNMTLLALRGSSFRNGVSRVHGDVSATICREVWPEIEPANNPIDYVTNGVHVPSFLSEMWRDIFDRAPAPGGWNLNVTEAAYWQGVHAIPDHQFWSVRQSIKSQMLHLVRDRIRQQHARNHGSDAHLDRLLKFTDPDNPNTLTIGFARRFATYKRAALLFENLEWLRQIVDHDRPVLFIFAGKAHPADEPGQALIRRITEVAAMPEFESHILMVEGYDLHISRRLVAGVDVWLNNPIYPLEASGTSGMKAGINGCINLSVLDGWWAEGFVEGVNANGWAIKPVPDHYDAARRNYEEARTLYELLQDKVVPLYYERNAMGYSPGWVAMAKRSIATVAPEFNSVRMVNQYVAKFYAPAAARWVTYGDNQCASARQLSLWKKQVRSAWSGVKIRWLESPKQRINYGESIDIEVAVRLSQQAPNDVRVELLLSRPGSEAPPHRCYQLAHRGQRGDGEDVYGITLAPDICGKVDIRVRLYPHHHLLPHPFEMGMMLWL